MLVNQSRESVMILRDYFSSVEILNLDLLCCLHSSPEEIGEGHNFAEAAHLDCFICARDSSLAASESMDVSCGARDTAKQWKRSDSV